MFPEMPNSTELPEGTWTVPLKNIGRLNIEDMKLPLAVS